MSEDPGVGCWRRPGRHWLRAELVALLFALAGCDVADGGPSRIVESAGADSVEAVDDTGRAVRLDAPATRVISLLPATTETITALGAGERLIARTDYDADPEYAHLPSVGGGLTPSLEAIVALRPDLVIAWEEAGTARLRPRLEELGIRVFGVRTQDTTAIFANIERLGHLLGLDGAADSLGTALRAKLDSVRESVTDRRSPSVLYVIGLEPPIIAGPNVFIGEMVEVAGGRNVFADVAAPSPQVSVEEIVRREPEVLIVPTADDRENVLARLRGLSGWRDLLARGQVRVETIPIDLLHRPGPGIGEAAQALRDVIHPRKVVGP